MRLALTVNKQQNRWDQIVLLDDDPAKCGKSILGLEIAGPFSSLERADKASSEIVNLVARTTEKRLSARRKLDKYGMRHASLIHPSVDTTGATFHEGVTVYQNATIGPLVSLGRSSVIFMGAVVGHGSSVGEGCIVGPNAVINARVQIDNAVYVGTNATILPDVRVGARATIAAGSVAMKNVPEGITVIGNPAKSLPQINSQPATRTAEPRLSEPHDLRAGIP